MEMTSAHIKLLKEVPADDTTLDDEISAYAASFAAIDSMPSRTSSAGVAALPEAITTLPEAPEALPEGQAELPSAPVLPFRHASSPQSAPSPTPVEIEQLATAELDRLVAQATTQKEKRGVIATHLNHTMGGQATGRHQAHLCDYYSLTAVSDRQYRDDLRTAETFSIAVNQ